MGIVNPEKKISHEPLSGTEFISRLEQRVGGKLYFGVDSKFSAKFSDITSVAPYALSTLKSMVDQDLFNVRPLPHINLSEDIVSDFSALVMSGMPYPAKSDQYICLLANSFCRGYWANRLEGFFENCLGREKDQDEDLIITDELPVKVEFSGVVFDTSLKLSSGGEYIAHAKARAQKISLSLNLSAVQRTAFITEFYECLDMLDENVRLLQSQMNQFTHNDSIHSVIRMEALVTYLKYQAVQGHSESKQLVPW